MMYINQDTTAPNTEIPVFFKRGRNGGTFVHEQLAQALSVGGVQ